MNNNRTLDKYRLKYIRKRCANPWWEYRIGVFEKNEKETMEYHFIHTNGGVVIVPFDPQRLTLIMIYQRRLPFSDVFLEFPAGGIKPGESPLEAARRELFEETGYLARHWIYAGRFVPYLGVTDEICHVFISYGIDRVSPPKFQEDLEMDNIRVTEIAFAEADLVLGRECRDGKSLAAWFLASRQLTKVITNLP